jgi:DNA-binding transcriptional MocR family regulator
MPKTIRELADELKVSKQTIQYHYQRLPTKNQQKDSQGANMISLTAERIIRDKVARNQQTGSKKATKTSKENNDLVATLRSEVEDLKSQRDKQLATKDQQIENLTKLLDQSQQLQLIAEKKIEEFKTLSSKIDNASSNNPPKKYVWWRFWK